MFYADTIGLTTLLAGMHKYRRHVRADALAARPVARAARRAWTQHRANGRRSSGGGAMKLDDLIAIDVHTHAEVSCRQEPDEAWQPFEAASAKYFKAGKRPTIAETIAYYRERKIGLVMFTVDSRIPDRRAAHPERGSGRCRTREQRHHDRLRQHRSAQGQDGRARSAPPDRRRRDPRLQVPSDAAGLLPERPHGLSALRGHRGAQAAGDLPQRPLRAWAPACRAAAACA